MADVSISYKDATIAQMSASGTKTLLTADNYCENNIVVEYTRPTASDLVSGTLSITENGTGIDVTNYANVDVNVSGDAPTLQTKSVTPTETMQVITPDSGYDGLAEVDIDAISSDYVGTGITRRSSSDLTASGATVTAPAGYYESAATKTVASGEDVPVFTLITNASGEVVSLTCNKTFNECLQLVTAFEPKTAAVVKTYFQTLAQHSADYGLSGYDDFDTQHYIVYDGYFGGYSIRYNADGTIVRVPGPEPETQDKIVNITPSTTAQSQTVVGDTGYFLNEVTINTAAMPAGTAGTPTATKGIVSNYSVSVTPSVTNTTGYITGQTKTGTAVTVSASELVSGNKAITSNGDNIDVTNYATVSVNVSSGGGNIFLITLTQNQNYEFIPDCTFAEYLSAYQANKTISAQMADATTNGSIVDIIEMSAVGFTCSIQTFWINNEGEPDQETIAVNWNFVMNSQGYSTIPVMGYYDITNATAVASDVARGKYFYGSQGIDIGTATSSTPNLQARTNINPTTSSQTITADSGYDGLSSVQINAMPSGTAGTPTATKSSVSNHSITVTPSVTNTTGYITGSTINGTGVSVTASELASGNKEITSNGNNIDVVGYSTVSVNVSGGGSGGPVSPKQINFIDYDGTIVESYTKSEWQNVTALPSNPSHSGLTAQGWNWTKAQIDEQLTAMPDDDVWVGQMYITDDGKTRIYIHLEKGRLHPYFGICPNGTVVIDWGDNSATTTLTGTSLTTVQTADHEYASASDYVITLTVSSGSFAFFGVSNTSYILRKNTTTTSNIHKVYANAVQKVELGSGATIGTYAFKYCSSLASITIPSGVTSIGDGAFYYCYALASITIPSGVTSIRSNAFNSCYSLASITIPSGVTSIEMYAFNACYSLASITIPSDVTSIGSNAFTYCSSLASITIPSGVTSIGNNAFYYCYSLASITIPSNVTSIGSNAFTYCYSLTSITIPSGVTSVGTYVFSSCSSLASITIPSGVTSVGNYAFNSCYSLASITIPSDVTSIGNNAFSGCYGMAEYHIKPTTPPTLGKNVFQNIQSDCIIYVPSASLTAYQKATNWSTYASYMRGE